jgi:hypothetical protein
MIVNLVYAMILEDLLGGVGNGCFGAIHGELTQWALQTHEGFDAHNKSMVGRRLLVDTK